MLQNKSKIVTFLSDFGTADGYAGSVKGVIKSISSEIEIIDVSHDIEPFNIDKASFAILNYYEQYPIGTIHLAVVDPGVGGFRKPLIVRTAHYYFVGPDNGLFRYLFLKEACTLYEIIPQKIMDAGSGFTFHARDIFGPVAARLACGESAEKYGRKLDDRTHYPRHFQKTAENELELKTISIDRFGNIIVDFSKQDLVRLKKDKVESVRVKNFKTETVNRFYDEKEPGELLVLWNNLGFLEIAAAQGSAVNSLNFKSQTDRVYIILS